ncbi:MAG: Threonine synthase [Syntrophomonadaceae bacterium]|nr:Threonine synthase [Bacillota bacterium]MBT9146677.1 Threonine synthase [Bacillota bacterium]
MMWRGIIERYREHLPAIDKSAVISLQEGNTPLVRADNLRFFLKTNLEIFLKVEGLNPTGSFKDRGMTVAVSRAAEKGQKAIICASTGNTSASAAAYAARANIKCIALIPKGAIALGKLAQALIHSARVLAIDGNFDDALRLTKEIVVKYPITLVNSLNPDRIEGQKTGAFEIVDELGGAPDYQFIPVGNAGNIFAYWKGYKEYHQAGKAKKLPRMMGFQAAGAAPIVRGEVIENPETVATAIRIGNPANWQEAEAARDESQGIISAVSDDEILDAYQMLAALEGIFVEPASAAGVAGMIKLCRQGYFKKAARVVCILTGHGLKDPERAVKVTEEPKIVPANIGDVLKAANIEG